MAAENKLSDKQLKSMLGKPLDKQRLISDGKGMSVRVSINGAVSFVMFYRLGGRGTAPVWLTLGKYPDISLKMAREKRDECRTWLAEGIDPRHRIGLMAEGSQKPATVKDALEYWLQFYAKPKRRTWEICQQRFERYIYRRFGDIPLSQCTAATWVKCFDEVRKTAPVAAGHTFRDVKQALKFCRVRRYATSNELEDFTVMDMGERAKKRDRVLTADEIRDVWYWANIEEGNNKLSTENRTTLIVLMVFGCRGRELRKSTWAEWDFKDWIWTVPKEHSKNGREIIRPIPPQIRQWLVNLRAIAEEEGTERLLIGTFSKQTVLSTVGSRFWRKFKHEKPWSLHDLRRVLATNLNDMGVDPHVVEQLLGHTLPGVMGIYNRSQYMAAKLEALTRWVDYLNQLAFPELRRSADV